MDELIILKAIPFTESCDFREFLNDLPDVPENKSEWAQLFRQLEKLELDGMVEISRSGRDIDTMQLLEAGAERVRAAK